MATSVFKPPMKEIFQEKDLNSFLKSEAYSEIVKFVQVRFE